MYKRAYWLAAFLTICLALVAYWVVTAPNVDSREQVCAKRLGVVWSAEDGVTERLDAWEECMGASR